MRVLFVTLPQADAEAMLMLLLRERLVAGGTILPTVHSRYWWHGEIVGEKEAAILMETARDKVEAASRRVRELHPYDTPRLLVLNPTDIPGDYFRWVFAETR